VAYDPGDADFAVVGDVSDEQRAGLDAIRAVMADLGGTGVQTALNAAVYDLLDQITVYPVQDAGAWTDGTGTVLPDAFLLPDGATPLDLAYAVHSDIGDGYLHAVDARSNRRIGEDHALSEGDVVKIVSTASA
jgi:Predicted GTPase, probable translation factor